MLKTSQVLRKALFITVLAILTPKLFSQSFTKLVIDVGPGAYHGRCLWVDYDNDDDLDFIVTGQRSNNGLITYLVENRGNDVFNLANAPRGFTEGALDLLNINGDEYIDFIMHGRAIGADNNIETYLNTGEGLFLESVSIIQDFSGGSGSFSEIISGDVNNDMTTDIFITGIVGSSGGNPIVKGYLYHKSYDNTYQKLDSIDDPVYIAGARFFDVDGDQDLDLIYGGRGEDLPFQRTELLINTNGSFSTANHSQLVQVQNASIDIGDYDNDGDLDVIMTGLNAQIERKTHLYKNTNGELTLVEDTGLNDHAGAQGSVKWGDFDGDGDLDLLFNGNPNISQTSFEVMENLGNDKFSRFAGGNFEDLGHGYAVWGDYDNDNDLDILATGFETQNNPRILVYRNDMNIQNSPPSVPGNLRTVVVGDSVSLSWDAASDDKTPVAALTYNLNIMDSENNQILYSFSNLDNGFRKKAGMGNVGNSLRWYFKDLPEGEYHWTVQSIDGAYIGSDFAETATFAIGPPTAAPSDLTASIDQGNVDLAWTDNSSNEDYFVIERKVDLTGDFVKLDSVTSNITEFTDTERLTGTIIYRVNAVNSSGRSDYTSEAQIVVTSIEEVAANTVVAYPNPFKNQLTIVFEEIFSSNMEIELVQLDGRSVSLKKLDAGASSVTFDTSQIPSGMYLMKVVSNDRYWTMKLKKSF